MNPERLKEAQERTKRWAVENEDWDINEKRMLKWSEDYQKELNKRHSKSYGNYKSDFLQTFY